MKNLVVINNKVFKKRTYLLYSEYENMFKEILQEIGSNSEYYRIADDESVKEAGGLRKLFWEKFIEKTEWVENPPTLEEYEKAESQYSLGVVTNFRSDFPKFSFVMKESESIKDAIISMNPVFTDSKKYLGTLDEVLATGELPTHCIFIANSLTPEQQSKLNLLTAKGSSWVSTESTSGQGFFVDVETRWEILFM